jgi:hypothetical protein
VPNPGLIDDDAPETTDEQLAGMRPAREVLPPDFYAMVTKRKLGPSDPANQRKRGRLPRKPSTQGRLKKSRAMTCRLA